MTDLYHMLDSMAVLKASDLYLNGGAPPTFKVDGELRSVSDTPLNPDEIRELVEGVLDDEQRQHFEQQLELDISLHVKNGGRFRINVYRQRGELALVARHIKDVIPTVEQLHLPDVLNDFAMARQGLVLVVGATGSGKSSTLAAMLNYRNEHRQGHILTVEDPIEFIHYHKRSLVSQREVGVDTHSYSDALKYAMREAPDVIMIGEIRDQDTARQALRYAETGHLCLSTMHATSANQAIDRFVNFFPPDYHRQTYQDLAFHLYAIVGQRLARGLQHKRVPVVEILINNAYVHTLIEKGDTQKIKEVMTKANSDSSQTFDDALYELVLDGQISKEEANRLADSNVDIGLRFRLAAGPENRQFFANKTHWLDHTVDFSRYQTIAVRAKKASLETRPDLERLLTEAISRTLRGKGYQVVSDNADLILKYAFGLNRGGNSEESMVKSYTDDYNMPEHHKSEDQGGLVMQVKETESDTVRWRMQASRPLGRRPTTLEALGDEMANMLATLPRPDAGGN